MAQRQTETSAHDTRTPAQTQPLRLVLLLAEWNALTEAEQEAIIQRLPAGKRLRIVRD